MAMERVQSVSIHVELVWRHWKDIYSPKLITLIIYGLLSGCGKGLNWHSSVLYEGGQQVGTKLSPSWV